MSSEKEKLKAQEAQQNNQYSEAPPPYEQLQHQDQQQQQQAPPPQQSYPQQGYSQGNQYPQQNNYDKPPQTTQGYDVSQDPNVYKIAPDKVNIDIAPSQYTHPQYQEFLQNEPMRQQRGDYLPQNQPKYGAKLDKGHTSSNKQNKGFPGSSGVTYHNAANR